MRTTTRRTSGVRRKRRWLLPSILLGLVALLVLGWGLDLPRRAVVQVLEVILGADVELEAVRFDGEEFLALDQHFFSFLC